MAPSVILWLIVAVLLVALMVLVLVLGRRRDLRRRILPSRPPRDRFGPQDRPRRQRRAGVVLNPTKFADIAAVRAQITARFAVHGWAEPLFLETTKDDPGTGQARAALDAEVDIVCGLGGDGTLRSIAVALAGGRTPLAVLPSGTGNLLARNLDLPVFDLDLAVDVAASGHNRRIDVGRMELSDLDRPESAGQHLFLVMAGLGFDAEIMSGAPEALKAKVGWPAYFVSGIRGIRGRRFSVTIAAGDDPEVVIPARTVVFGNCGRIMGGIQLMPNATIDDGLLDALVLSPKGLPGWAVVAGNLLRRSPRDGRRMSRTVAESFTVTAAEPQDVQLDGDLVGSASRLQVSVWPGALIVRVPQHEPPVNDHRR